MDTPTDTASDSTPILQQAHHGGSRTGIGMVVAAPRFREYEVEVR